MKNFENINCRDGGRTVYTSFVNISFNIKLLTTYNYLYYQYNYCLSIIFFIFFDSTTSVVYLSYGRRIQAYTHNISRFYIFSDALPQKNRTIKEPAIHPLPKNEKAAVFLPRLFGAQRVLIQPVHPLHLQDRQLDCPPLGPRHRPRKSSSGQSALHQPPR